MSQTRVTKELIHVELTDDDDSRHKCFTQAQMKDRISQQPLGQWQVSTPRQVTFTHTEGQLPGGNTHQETLELNPKPSCPELPVLTTTCIFL